MNINTILEKMKKLLLSAFVIFQQTSNAQNPFMDAHCALSPTEPPLHLTYKETSTRYVNAGGRATQSTTNPAFERIRMSPTVIKLPLLRSQESRRFRRIQ